MHLSVMQMQVLHRSAMKQPFYPTLCLSGVYTHSKHASPRWCYCKDRGVSSLFTHRVAYLFTYLSANSVYITKKFIIIASEANLFTPSKFSLSVCLSVCLYIYNIYINRPYRPFGPTEAPALGANVSQLIESSKITFAAQ